MRTVLVALIVGGSVFAVSPAGAANTAWLEELAEEIVLPGSVEATPVEAPPAPVQAPPTFTG
jgi:hypothetical protein